MEISSNSPMGVPLSSSFGFTSKLFGGMAATVLMLSPPALDNVSWPRPKLRRAVSVHIRNRPVRHNSGASESRQIRPTLECGANQDGRNYVEPDDYE